MMDYTGLIAALEAGGGERWAECLPAQLSAAFSSTVHGDLSRWQGAIDSMPALAAIDVDLLTMMRVGRGENISVAQQQQLHEALMALHPWRKGPFQLFGIDVDTEWRSDWKWDRLSSHISPLRHRLVLDVGCGNGYHCWRMLGEQAKLVVGIDPTLLSVMQFQAVKKLHGDAPIYVLPLGIEAVPENLAIFDTVFSMGVLYHRRSPIDHLLELKGCLRPGGELILETLVIDGNADQLLMPEQRYARMRNIWFLPSCEMLMLWMRRCGFKNIRLVDVTKTTVDEQRSTAWMKFQSLPDFLDPDNSALTCEGLPAPLRAIVVANVD